MMRSSANRLRLNRGFRGTWRRGIQSRRLPPWCCSLMQQNLQTLITYASGTTIEHNGQPGWGPAMGEWKYAGSETFDVTWLKFIYDLQGQRTGTVKIRAKI